MRKNVDFDGIQAQVEWLDQTLSNMVDDTSIVWKVIVTHNPLFSAGKGHGNNKDLQNLILPILKKYKVDMVLTGHDHNSQYLRMDMNSREETDEGITAVPQDCGHEEFIATETAESIAMQGEHMHHFVMGNGGIKHSRFCPSKQATSAGKLLYGNAVSGVGDVTIREDMIEVKLVSKDNEQLYSLKVVRNMHGEQLSS